MTARSLLTPDLPPRFVTPDLPGACVPVVPKPTAASVGRGRFARPGDRRESEPDGEHREEGGDGHEASC
ncbi:hypothetical protein [Streptomyces sp. ADI98-10]|uniref:hypothetical protein n=1 Tax=Streptomyces sp. ADI98-10 TaxID=1522763 RepID=UPI000F556DDF|nr:hypothetical protein [Streptomyces sp. ADI98-10]RPK94521.1 hypothetical protein EES46_01025 [Streptomyces sp. ADI98-10]